MAEDESGNAQYTIDQLRAAMQHSKSSAAPFVDSSADVAEEYRTQPTVSKMPTTLAQWEAVVSEAQRTGVLQLPGGEWLTGIPLTSYLRVARQELREGIAHESGRPFWPGEIRPPR